jgi:FKBP-type peptidyl-prolyl cis-trans isomerase 2
MPIIRYIMLISAIAISAMGLAVVLEGHGYLVQALPSFVKSHDETVRDGMKVTVRFQITPQDHPTMTYSDTQEFIQGQHMLPPGLEQQIAGMHQGESTTFPLSAEEGFGPYDATKLQIIPTGDLPPEAREGDTVSDDAGRHGRIIGILPENALIDLNHPLAGQPLIVSLQIVTIENPDEEIRTHTVPGPDNDQKLLPVGWPRSQSTSIAR